MSTELWALLGAVCLGIVHVSADSFSFKAQVGNAYTVGPRDQPKARAGLAGRLHRAARNYTENLILFVAVVALLQFSGKSNSVSEWASWAWVAGRLCYLVAYARGTPWVRTVFWQISMAALVAMVVALFIE